MLKKLCKYYRCNKKGDSISFLPGFPLFRWSGELWIVSLPLVAAGAGGGGLGFAVALSTVAGASVGWTAITGLAVVATVVCAGATTTVAGTGCET